MITPRTPLRRKIGVRFINRTSRRKIAFMRMAARRKPWNALAARERRPAAAPFTEAHQATEEKALAARHEDAEEEGRNSREKGEADQTRSREQPVVKEPRRPDRRRKTAADRLHQPIRRGDQGDDFLGVRSRGAGRPAQAELKKEARRR